MSKIKKIIYIFITLILVFGISVVTSQNVFAATLTTKTYIVKRGDCLASIARSHGESLNNLRKANNKWNDSIFPGQALNVPATVNKIATINKPVTANLAAEKSKPVVQKSNPAILNSKSVVVKYTASDLNLLARLIMAEAQGETYSAQVAVGAVVLNRVNSSSYPNSISAVINQKMNGRYQFTPVQNGHINRPANASAVKAAYAALNGSDVTNNAMFYYDVSSHSRWISSLTVTIKIGKMIFAR